MIYVKKCNFIFWILSKKKKKKNEPDPELYSIYVV